jgi:PAS domain-containing protein
MMPKVDRWTPQIWHCDPLIVCNDAGEILYADKATVEFIPLSDGDLIGRARVTDADPSPPIQIEVRARMDRHERGPDPRLGIRSGATLTGVTPDGREVEWYTDGAADVFMSARADEARQPPRHWESLTIREIATGEILFDGPADVVRGLPSSALDLESLHLVGAPHSIEVRDSRRTLPTLAVRHFGEVCIGTDADGREVEWTLGGHRTAVQ